MFSMANVIVSCGSFEELKPTQGVSYSLQFHLRDAHALDNAFIVYELLSSYKIITALHTS